MAQEVIVKFKDLLKAHFAKTGIPVRRWVNGNSSNILEIGTISSPILLYVKNSNLKLGFWGLHPYQMDALSRSGQIWFLVFLKGTCDKGYLLTSRDAQICIQHDKWPISSEGDYKVHEQYLSPNSRFTSFDSLVSRIRGLN